MINDKEFVDIFYSWSSKEQLKWMLSGGLPKPYASQQLGDPCRWCVHFESLCKPYAGCINYDMFKMKPRKQNTMETANTSANTQNTPAGN